MTYIEAMAYINEKPEMIWESLSDLRKFPEWLDNLGEIVQPGEGQAINGASFRQRLRIVGAWNPMVRWQALEVEAPQKQVFEGKGTGLENGRVTITLDEVPTGTQLTVAVELKYKWYVSFLAWILLERLYLRRTMETRLRRTVDAGKAVAETRPAKALP